MPAVDVSGLVVRYGSTVAVDGVSFTADAGEVVALLGPNGAGKTTTVETLEGYRRRDAGAVRVLGLDPRRDHAALVPQIGVMPQRGGVYPQLTPAEAVRLFASYYGGRADDVESVLARVGLSDQRVAGTPWRRLSGGEQQRTSLALALIGRPSVVFLDEPTAGVDPAGRLAIRALVRSLRDGGACVLLTTHELDEAERVADRVVIVDHGRVVASGTPAELMSSAAAGESIRFAAAPGVDVTSLAAVLGGDVVESSAGEYEARVAASPANVAALTAWLAERGVPLADLRAGRESLEDVFLRLTSE